MKLIAHLFIYNLKFNKVRLSFLTFISFVIVGLSYYLNDDLSQAGSDILQYSSYVIFIIITGKMNLRNNLMFDIKHLMSLPISKREIVFSKSIADIVHFFPITLVFLFGFSLTFPSYHILVIGVLFHLVIVLANMVSLNKRIDFARMQHSKASFKNSFLYLNKYLDFMIQISIVVFLSALVFAGFEKQIILQEYAFSILIILFTFIMFTSTVKMLKDETLSYFILKRDLKRITVKLLIVAIPAMSFYGVKKVYKSPKANQNLQAGYFTNLEKEIGKYTVKVDEQKFLLAITMNQEKEIENYLKTHKELPWDLEVLGGYLPHLAAAAGNNHLMEVLLNDRPDSINMLGKVKKRTPIFNAVRRCKLATLEYLIDNGANINHTDIHGDSPIIFAAKNNCYGGVVILHQKGANVALVNEKQKDVFFYLNGSGIDYLIQDKTKRAPASIEK